MSVSQFSARRKAAIAFDCSPPHPQFRHQAPVFMCSGFSDPLGQVVPVLAITLARDVLRLAKWVRSGPMWHPA